MGDLEGRWDGPRCWLGREEVQPGSWSGSDGGGCAQTAHQAHHDSSQNMILFHRPFSLIAGIPCVSQFLIIAAPYPILGL